MASANRLSVRLVPLLIAGGILAVAAVLGLVAGWPFSPSSEAQLALARNELKHERYATAEALANRVSPESPHHTAALLVAGEAATKLGRLEDGLAYYSRAPDDGSRDAVLAAFSAAEIALNLGKLSQADRNYRLVLRHLPTHTMAHNHLAYLLGATGRRWESASHLLELLRQGQFDVTHLILLGDLERTLDEKQTFALGRRSAPDDPWLLLGLARVAIHENRLDEAERLLRQVVAQVPNDVEAQCRLGGVILERDSDADWQEWNARLPAAADEHPETWICRGGWAQRNGDIRGAARCYWQAICLDPTHRQASYRLGQLLVTLGETAKADVFVARGKELQSLNIVLDELFHSPQHVPSMQRAAQLCESLGRLPEAWAWAQVAQSHDPQLRWPREMIDRLEPKLANEWHRCLPSSNPALLVDLSTYPLPRWNNTPDSTLARSSGFAGGPPPATGRIEFADQAAEAGLSFRYFNGHERQIQGARIFETTGGGVGVLDFDGDLWPDLYFTQGRRWPTTTTQSEHLDKLYQNLGNGRFLDVTASSGLGDDRFSQGPAVGDFNNDGFADLYVANLGANRLYRNEGDGTFTDVSTEAGIVGESWTTSSAIADFNGDGWPDIFDTNYCDPRDNLELVCEKQGVLQSCSPRTFAAAQDRLLLSLGDGRFADVTVTAGITAPDGYGLGVVAADFNGSGRLSLFVANDETPNFYFDNRMRPGDISLTFTEHGVLSGLANDENGVAQACMGVAAGDANGNGRVDLFVTNFFHESNTLYVQQSDGLFLDHTRKANLRDGSYAMLGFGAQFLDADLDGWPDLVLTNGHIDDLTRLGRPYKMPPQCYRNTGGGRFVELSAASLGKFFEGRYLGRGLARVDWNRDGRPDFVVSHIDSPAALVTNQTHRAGGFVAIEFRGVESARDAIGATVRLFCSDRQWTQQITAGDGYQASNQRQLLFGVGGHRTIDQIHIRWPSGREDRYSSPPVNSQLIAIEGAGLYRLLPPDE